MVRLIRKSKYTIVGGKKLIKTSIGLKITNEVKLDLIFTLQPTTHVFYSLINMISLSKYFINILYMFY